MREFHLLSLWWRDLFFVGTATQLVILPPTSHDRAMRWYTVVTLLYDLCYWSRHLLKEQRCGKVERVNKKNCYCLGLGGSGGDGLHSGQHTHTSTSTNPVQIPMTSKLFNICQQKDKNNSTRYRSRPIQNI